MAIDATSAVEPMARLLEKQGRGEEAIALWRAQDGGDTLHSHDLFHLLVGQGRMEEATSLLRAQAGKGNAFEQGYTVQELAALLVSRRPTGGGRQPPTGPGGSGRPICPRQLGRPALQAGP